MNELVWSNGKIVADNDKIWITSFYYRLVCSFDLNKKIVNQIYKLPNNGSYENAYLGLIEWEGYLVLIPSCDNIIYIFDKIGNLIKDIPINSRCLGQKYLCSTVLKDEIYLFPIDEKNIIHLRKDVDGNFEFDKVEIEYNGFVSSETLGDVVYLVNNSEYLFIYNLVSQKMDKQYICSSGISCISTVNDEQIILINSEGEIISYFIPTNNKEVLNVKVEHCNTSCYVDDFLYAFPRWNTNGFYKVNTKDKTSTFVDILCSGTTFIQYGSVFGQLTVDDKVIYVTNMLKKSILSINTETDEIQEYLLNLNVLSPEEQKIIVKQNYSKRVIHESEEGFNSFDCFLKYLLE